MKMLRTIVFVIASVALLAGCATKNKVLAPVFYPPDAGVARMQHLRRISRPEDVEPRQSLLLTFLMGAAPAKQRMLKPYGLALSGDNLYICDTVGRQLHIVDLKKNRWSYFHGRNITATKKPINLDVDSRGKMYVADAGHGQVLIFSSNLVFVGSIGEAGSLKPVDVKVKHGKVYVADMKSQSIRVYDEATRRLLFGVPLDAESEDKDKKLFSPTNIDVDDKGNIYVSDTGAFRVQKYDKTGKHIRQYGRIGRQYGQFARNKGVAVDREERVYVVDSAFQTVQIFDKEGQLLMFFGETGTPRGSLYLPAGMIVDYNHNHLFEEYVDPRFELDFIVLVVSQLGPRGVEVYGMLRKKD